MKEITSLIMFVGIFGSLITLLLCLIDEITNTHIVRTGVFVFGTPSIICALISLGYKMKEDED